MIAEDAPRTVAAERRALGIKFQNAGIDTTDADARLLIAHALDIDRATLLTHGHRVLRADEIAAIDALATRRLKREPVARIIGQKEFWSLPLTVTPDVLSPRPETETVVELALDTLVRDALSLERLHILDIGTGSGALLLALLSELQNATGTGTDISAAALEVARANAARNGVAARCRFITCDMASEIVGSFDLIVSNPPYIKHGDISGLEPEVRDFDPIIALDGGPDGVDAYRAIGAQSVPLLAPGGRLIVEFGRGQEEAVRALFTKTGLKIGAVRVDLAGIPRALEASLP